MSSVERTLSFNPFSPMDFSLRKMSQLLFPTSVVLPGLVPARLSQLIPIAILHVAAGSQCSGITQVPAVSVLLPGTTSSLAVPLPYAFYHEQVNISVRFGREHKMQMLMHGWGRGLWLFVFHPGYPAQCHARRRVGDKQMPAKLRSIFPYIVPPLPISEQIKDKKSETPQ